MEATRRAARRYGVPGGLAVLLGVLLIGPPAQAETAGQAEATAHAALARVRALQPQVDRALADYGAATRDVAAAVTAGVSADEYAVAADQEATERRAAAGARVRALYRAGGPLAIYASALDGRSISEVMSRVGAAQRLVGSEARDALAVDAVAVEARRDADAYRAAALAEVRQTRALKRSFGELDALLAQQEAELDALSARARNLRAAEETRARLQAARAAAQRAARGATRRLNPLPGSPEYFRLYRAAATTCPGLSWSVLAAIGQVETGHGRNTNTSYAGAQGPMQFMPATFARYGVDGDGDGVVDVRSAADAIYSAASYLCANGAGRGGAKLYFAVFRYNHADWYVRMVLDLAAKYLARDGA